MNSYELSRAWFDFCFENPDKVKPNHTALYFFCIEHCNRLGWKERFGLPTTMAKEAIGIRSYNTYKNTLFELVEFGFIKMVETSKNQYSSNIIALSKFNKALDKALDKALIKHTSKQSESTHQSIDSIIKQLTKEQLNKKQVTSIKSIIKKYDDNNRRFIPPTLDQVQEYCKERNNKVSWNKFIDHYTSNGWKVGKNKMQDWKAAVRTWEKNSFESKSTKQTSLPISDYSTQSEDDNKF